jgi:hypothetical protein
MTARSRTPASVARPGGARLALNGGRYENNKENAKPPQTYDNYWISSAFRMEIQEKV